LCVNLGSCGCVSTLDIVPFLLNYFLGWEFKNNSLSK
jgi:hypothetical protein